MTSKETFTHYQPLGNSDPAHTATAPGGLSAKAPAMTPLMLDTSTRKLVAWDGTTDGAAVGILAVDADQTSTTLTFYKSGTFRYEDVLWPEAASDETKKRTAFAGTAISIVLTLPFITKGRLCGFFYGIFLCRCTQPPSCWRQMSRNLSLIRCFCVSFSVRAIPSLRRKSISHKFRDW
ncbi:Head decoration protein from bacteriophage origin [Escherichia coli]|uniref:Head decoration protein from bacteriophage origin n=22 Tax=Escherichia coli TaxID=562 RepID=A0A376S921_ECOLX|nr:Head decoration protein from bacteriophage origin [Escherichia coli]